MTSSKTANYVYAAPNGSAGAPSFRKLVAADIPSLAAGKITSGTLSSSRLPISTTQTNSTTKVPSSSLVYSMQTKINELNDAITSGNITTKPAQYTITGVVNCVSSYGHSVSVTLGDQAYTISGFSMKIVSSTTNMSGYEWSLTSSKVVTYSDVSTSTVTFSIGSDGYITYSTSRGSESPYGSTVHASATIEFICNVS